MSAPVTIGPACQIFVLLGGARAPSRYQGLQCGAAGAQAAALADEWRLDRDDHFRGLEGLSMTFPRVTSADERLQFRGPRSSSRNSSIAS